MTTDLTQSRPVGPRLHIQARPHRPGTVLVAIAGEVDMDTAPELQLALTEVLRVDRPTHIVLDMERLDFLDSAGICALVRCRTAAERHAARIVLSHARGHVRRVLEITGLLDLFDTGADARP